jgi:OOP family OmpA-OmpF porin
MFFVWLLTLFAWAQTRLDAVTPEVDAHVFRLSVDSDTALWTDDAGTVLDKPLVRGRVGFHFAAQPHVLAYSAAEGLTSVQPVGALFQVEVNQVIHINRFRFGIDLPLWLEGISRGNDFDPTLSEIALDGRVTLVDPAIHGFGLAAGARWGVPTLIQNRQLPGTARRRYLEPDVVAEVRKNDWSVALNLSYRFVSHEEAFAVAWGDTGVVRLALGRSFNQDNTHVSVETLNVILGRNPGVVDGGLRGTAYGTQLVAAGWHRLHKDLYGEASLGVGPTPAVATPLVRGYIGIAAHPSRDGAKDADDDGLVDLVDQCRLDPEDFDEFEDQDGCSEPDNDQDGILDANDACPLEAEDTDEFQDEDGCPELDNDRDRIPDVDDQCPNEREDYDDYQDQDGCKDPSSRVVVEVANPSGLFLADADVRIRGNGLALDGKAGDVFELHDAIYEISSSLEDHKPAELQVTVDGEAEPRKFVNLVLEPIARVGSVRVRVLTPDGAVVPGADVAITDTEVTGVTGPDGRVKVDKVPEGDAQVEVRAEGYGVAKVPVAVVFRQTVDVDVTLEPSRALLLRGRIEIRDSVYFETASATIRDISYPLLDDVAQIILDNPHAELVQVEGHTDSRGSDSYNLDLSRRRGASVRQYLIDAGVEPERLVSEGYGEQYPIDPREIPEAWDRNRRTDFYIKRWRGEDLDVDAERERVRQEAMNPDAGEVAPDPPGGPTGPNPENP